MRYFHIFLIHFHRVIENRSRSFVWTLLALFNPLIYLCFWLAVYKSSGSMIADWSLPELTSYYLLLTFAGSFLIAHIEESVALEDIYEGGLVRFILRPFSYFWDLYFGELGWRIFQGSIGLLIFFIFTFFFGQLTTVVTSPLLILLTVLSVILAFTLSFIFKMILGFSAFWLTEFRGLQSTVEIFILIFGGFIVPLHFLPSALEGVAMKLPFAYMVYYPILAIQGKLDLLSIIKILFLQLIWIAVFAFAYKIIWNAGLRRFTGVGN